MRIRLGMATALMAALLGSCAQNSAIEGSPPPAAVSPSGAVSSPTASATTAPSSPSPEPGPADLLVLGGDGLGLVSFGDAKADVIAKIEALLGPSDFTGPGCELRGPDVTTVGFRELTLTFDGEVFADYGVRVTPDEPEAFGLKTNHGIGLGSSVAELKAAYDPSRLQIPGLPADVFGEDNFAISFPGLDKELLGGLSGTADSSVITSFFTSVCE